MRIILFLLVLDLFFSNLLIEGCDNSTVSDVHEVISWESTLTKIREAKNESEIFQASEAYRNCGRDENNEIFHDFAQFICALTVTRMCIDEAYAKEVCPTNTSPDKLSSIDVNTVAKHWQDLLRANNTGGLADRIREAYKYIIPIDDAYIEEFGLSAAKTVELFRRYEPKIPELQAIYEKQLQSGIRLTMVDILRNHTDWNMDVDDVFTVNRIREAENRKKISWSWLDEENRKVIPYCPGS